MIEKENPKTIIIPNQENTGQQYENLNRSKESGGKTSAASVGGRPGDLRHVGVADRRLDAQELFGGGREVLIRHGAELYRLRLTSQDKLILTK